MRLTVVGCGDAFGSGGRGNACFLVESGTVTLALDFGATALVGLRRLGLDPNRLDAVVLSHLHGDHFGGLPFLRSLASSPFLRERLCSIPCDSRSKRSTTSAWAGSFFSSPVWSLS